jgi:hypothetical protein
MKDVNIDIEEGQKRALWHTIEEQSSKRYGGKATGYPATVPGKEAALPRQGTANARGDAEEPS